MFKKLILGFTLLFLLNGFVRCVKPNHILLGQEKIIKISDTKNTSKVRFSLIEINEEEAKLHFKFENVKDIKRFGIETNDVKINNVLLKKYNFKKKEGIQIASITPKLQEFTITIIYPKYSSITDKNRLNYDTLSLSEYGYKYTPNDEDKENNDITEEELNNVDTILSLERDLNL